MRVSRSTAIGVALAILTALAACAASGVPPSTDDVGGSDATTPGNDGGPGDPTLARDAGDAQGDGSSQALPDCIASRAMSSTLVINEVDYDQPGQDNAEFLEIYNRDDNATVDLSEYEVVFFNGAKPDAGEVYATYPLAGLLGPKKYLVIGTDGHVDAGDALFMKLNAAHDAIQNGPNDAVAILDRPSHRVIDSLSYGGPLGTPCMLTEGEPPAEKDSPDASGSMIRSPNGQDTNVNGSDWTFTTTITPGSDNQLTP